MNYTDKERLIVAEASKILKRKISREPAFASPDDVEAYAQTLFVDYDIEVVAVLFLDSRNRLISCEKMFYGTVNCANIHPREIVRRALLHNAASVIMAHNHPSGGADPSDADRTITKRVKQALELMEMQLIDHIVVGHGEFASLARLGWL